MHTSNWLWCSVDVHKLVVLAVRHVQERVLSQVGIQAVVPGGGVVMLHAPVLDLPGLAVGDPPALLHLVGDDEVDDLQADDGQQGAGDAHDLGQAGLVLGGVVGVEEQRADDVAGGGAGVVEGHDDGLFCGAGDVGDHPRDDERVPAEEEGEHVVGGQQRGHAVAAEDVEHDGAGEHGGQDGGEEGGLDAEAVGEVGGREDDDELDEAEGDVEQGAPLAVEAEAGDDDGAKGVCDGGGDVEADGHADEEPALGLVEGLGDLGPLEVAAAGAGLVGAQALDGLQLLAVGEEAGRGDIVVEDEVDEGRGEDGEEADEDEEDLPGVDGGGVVDLAEAVGDGGGEDGGQAVGAVPAGDAHGLLGAAVPLGGDDGEEGQAAGLEEAEEEAGGEQAGVVVAGGHADLGDAPAEDEARHEEAVRHLDDEPGREGLPGELGDGGDGADHGVLVAREVAVLAEAEDGAVPEDRLVEDLEEVDPDEDREDALVRLAADAFVLERHVIRCWSGLALMSKLVV
ncbi:hypothetical protein CTA2_12598 [Colletotrichum tanaceti]|uniref:Uncharacterized protein n=1 Tax=Colletotrichum tanaceti TaxID=1306861 RepID=A0A4U6XT38_9PEZI|nr:hypothetical protein CTA2_12598 [Colletotrichum tanaceti]TKW59123.1 hypothetical protein CTA1_849 [Colletotrichum tanaceti]